MGPTSSRLLFLSPCFPDPEGFGPARRAHAVITALSRRHQIVLLVISTSFGTAAASTGSLPSGCMRYLHLPPSAGTDRWLKLRTCLARKPRLFSFLTRQPASWSNHTPARRACAVRLCDGESFDVIHAFRMVVAPYALAIHRARFPDAALHLDTDDIEASTHLRIAALSEMNGDPSVRYRTAAAAYVFQQRRLFPRFHRLYTCSEHDARTLRPGHPDVRVLPNSVVVAGERPSAPIVDGPLRLLFIGTLNYYPNLDAVRWFCGHVLPAIREKIPCELIVAGRDAPASLAPLLNKTAGTRFLGKLKSSADAYREAHAIIVPLRAGGGTRLKILEAFSLGRPVISTALGIEGIEAAPEEHYLAAETPDDFVNAALRLHEQPELRARLARNGFELVRQRYGPSAVDRAVSGLQLPLP